MTIPADQLIDEYITKWLAAEDVAYEKVDVDGAAMALKLGTLVIVRPQSDDRVVVIGSVALPHSNGTSIGQIKEPVRSELLRAIAVILHGRTMKFRFAPDASAPSSISIAKTIYAETLNRGAFMQAVAEVNAAAALVALEISQQLRIPLPSPVSPTETTKPPGATTTVRDLRVQNVACAATPNGVQVTWAPPSFDGTERALVGYEVVAVVGGTREQQYSCGIVGPNDESMSNLVAQPDRQYGVRAIYRNTSEGSHGGVEFGPARLCGE